MMNTGDDLMIVECLLLLLSTVILVPRHVADHITILLLDAVIITQGKQFNVL